MTSDEFTKEQYLTLRGEIREAKARMFWLLVLGSVLVPVAGFAADQFQSTFSSVCTPFIVLVLMLAFVMEQNSIVRAGRYLKEHVEPHMEGMTTWESWLESNRDLRSVDRYFFGMFLVVFFLFYLVGAGVAIGSLAQRVERQWYYAGVMYGLGAIWFVVVLLRHWHSCTTTKK